MEAAAAGADDRVAVTGRAAGSRAPARRSAVLAFAVAFASLLVPSRGFAAAPGPEPQEPARPRIGLVLSGGGASGLAHVGVLRWLEEHHVPVDAIAGTSIGALIGAIYATGAGDREIREILDGIDWQAILRSEPPYELKAFRRKEDAREATATFELGLRNGFKLPPGINPGHQVGLFLDRLAIPYAEIESFDELPTPFACVATDLEAGEQVVYRDGPLAEALRATMAYPGWFAPVQSDDRVMIDGGALNNLPTDVARQMGADVVIAVDLGAGADGREPADTVLAVLNRTMAVMMRENTERNRALANVLIEPEVSDFGVTEFDRAEEAIEIGYRAAEAAAALLGAYRVDDAAWGAYLEARGSRRRSLQMTPHFIEVEGAGAVDAAVVEVALRHHVGVPLDPERLDDDLTEIVGWGRYDVAGYREVTRDGEAGLLIEIRAKEHGPPFLRPLLDLRGSRFGDAQITFGGRLTFYDVAGVNSEWRTDLTYGRRTRTATELFVPLGHAGFFVAPHAVADQSAQFLYEEGEAVAEYEVEHAGGGADLGWGPGPRSQLRLGFDAEYQRAHVKVGDPLLQPVAGKATLVRAQWSFDGANSPLLPTRGLRIETEADWVIDSPDAPDGFYQARFDLLGAGHARGRFSFFGAVHGGTSFGATAPALRQYLLGGPLRLAALGSDELRGSHFYLGQAGLLWALSDENKLSFFGTFYIAAFYEVGDAFEGATRPFHDVAFGLVGETLMGAVFVGVAAGEEGRSGFSFAIGKLF